VIGRWAALVAGVLMATAPAWVAAAAGATGARAGANAPAVRADVVKKTFTPVPGEVVDGAEKAAAGPVTVDAVVLENAVYRVTVVPALGGRIEQIVHKPSGLDLLAGDAAGDAAGGGWQVRFPCPEAGPPVRGGVAWRLVEEPDRAVTVAMDRRFRQFTGRGRRNFSPMRVGILVTLRPGAAAVEVATRVDNPLPLRQGFRLWQAVRFPETAAWTALVPVAATADAALATVRPFRGAGAAPGDKAAGRPALPWGVGPAGDWTGVYDPARDANYLLIRSRHTAPGIEVPAPAGRGDGAGIETAVGSNVTPAHPGHYLQAFGAYVLRGRLALVTGIGPVAWANRRVAVGFERSGRLTTVRVAGFGPTQEVRLILRSGDERREIRERLGPTEPAVFRAMDWTGPVHLTVQGANGDDLAQVTLPLSVPAADASAVDALRREIGGRDWSTMDLAGWHPPAGRPGPPEAVAALAQRAATEREDRLLAAARGLMQADTPGSVRWQAVRNRLDFLSRDAKHPAYLHAYLGLMMTLEAGGRATAETARHPPAALPLPAGHYLTALNALAGGAMLPALRHLKECAAQTPAIAMGLGSLGIAGNERRHPASLAGGQWTDLAQAAVLLEIKQPERAVGVLDRMLRVDPSRVEAVALMAEAHARLAEAHTREAAAHRRQAVALQADAERMLKANPQAARDLEALWEEVRLGRWSGIPRP